MGLYKEENAELKKWAARQGQVYPDAADYGVSTQPGDQAWREISKIISDVKEMGFNLHRFDHKYGSGRTIKVTFYLPWEYSTPGQPNDGYTCTKWVVEYVETYQKNRINYFTFHSERVAHIEEKEVYSPVMYN